MGRVCDGYGIWGGGGAIHQETAQPRGLRKQLQDEASRNPSNKKTTTLLHSSSPLIFGPRISPEEQKYLEWFIHGTATKTPRIFNSPFWDPIILQATMDEPMVLQAMLALSAVHKRKVLEPAKRARDGLAPDAQEIFLLKQYGSAIRNLQSYLENEYKPKGPKCLMAVIMCALFVLLEYTRGNFDAGFLHLTSGARLAKQLLSDPGMAGHELKLLHFFARLQDQTEVYRVQSQTDNETAATETELRFSDIVEADNHLDSLVDMMAHSAEQARMIPLSATASRKLFDEELAYLLASLEAWRLAYDATLAESYSKMPPETHAAWIALRKRYDMAMEMSEFQLQRSETRDSEHSATESKGWLADRGQHPHSKELEPWIGDSNGNGVMSKELLFVGTAWKG